MTIDGAYTSNDPQRRDVRHRALQAGVDIAQELGCDLMVLWLAREGTYMREAKDAVRAADQLLEAINDMLAYDAAAHRHRAEAQRADGPGLHPDHGPRGGAGASRRAIRSGWAC